MGEVVGVGNWEHSLSITIRRNIVVGETANPAYNTLSLSLSHPERTSPQSVGYPHNEAQLLFCRPLHSKD